MTIIKYTFSIFLIIFAFKLKHSFFTWNGKTQYLSVTMEEDLENSMKDEIALNCWKNIRHYKNLMRNEPVKSHSTVTDRKIGNWELTE